MRKTENNLSAISDIVQEITTYVHWVQDIILTK